MRRIRMATTLAAGLCLFAAPGCVSTKVKLMGPPNPPIDPTEVAVYGGLPANFREIALVEAHVYFTAFLSDEAKTSMAVDALARGAAGVGANGIMIRNLHPAAVNAFGHGHRAFRTGAVENNYAHMAPMHGVAIETP